jgi:phytoene desaturase
MLYLGLDGRLDQLPHHTVYLAEDYQRNIDQIDEGVVPDDPSFYMQNASVTDPTLAPPGQSTLYVLAPVSNQQGRIDWSNEAAPFRKKLLARLRDVAGEDVESRIVFEKVVTPEDWRRDYQIYNGATFNLAHNIGQMLCWRPQNRFGDLEGVYLVGGGTHPGSGLPVIFESARISTGLMAEDLGFAMPTAAARFEQPALMAGVGGKVHEW